MNFERGRDPYVSIGIGNLGRRGLSIKWPWVKSQNLQYHISYFVNHLNNWYKEADNGMAVFEFPARKDQNDMMNEFMITAAPGESTDCDSIYRKIEYDEIFSKFFRLVNGEEKDEFCLFLFNNDYHFFSFLRLDREF